jgi:hypothetical protein
MWPHRQQRGWLHLSAIIFGLLMRENEMNRREFLAASTAMAALASLKPAKAFAPEPLRALPRLRRVHAREEKSGSWLFYSDAPEMPRKVIRFKVIERVFGSGTYATLSQPDHWRMTDEGWFAGADLHQPIPVCDPTWETWRAFYHPVVEAHDLLSDALGYGLWSRPWLAPPLRNGLQLAEHPSTPRYATARVWSSFQLVQVADDVSRARCGVEVVIPEAVRHEVEEWHSGSS